MQKETRCLLYQYIDILNAPLGALMVPLERLDPEELTLIETSCGRFEQPWTPEMHALVAKINGMDEECSRVGAWIANGFRVAMYLVVNDG